MPEDMIDSEEGRGLQTQPISTEVESLFAESQAILSDRAKPYDYYVPLAVQIEDHSWNNLLPEETTDPEAEADGEVADPEEETESREVTMPIARVKRIMKMDPEVHIISKQATIAMAKATTLFIDLLASRLDEKVKQDGLKTVKNSHLIQVCSQNPSLSFLSEDLVSEESRPKRAKISTPHTVKTANQPNPVRGIKSFFQKK